MPEGHLLFSVVKKVNKKTTRSDSFPNHQRIGPLSRTFQAVA
jgi:hypothetical protein